MIGYEFAVFSFLFGISFIFLSQYDTPHTLSTRTLLAILMPCFPFYY
jgi:hypothetical protein